MKHIYIEAYEPTEEVCHSFINRQKNFFYTDIDELIEALQEGDEIIICDAAALNLSMRNLIAKIEPLRGMNLKIYYLNKCQMDVDTFLDALHVTLIMEQAWVTKKTKEGLETAKKKGRLAGRPKISEEKIAEIHKLYAQKLDYRSISYITNVSIGTVHKYVGGNGSKTEQNLT